MNIQKMKSETNLKKNNNQSPTARTSYATITLNSSAKLILIFVYTFFTAATTYYLSRDENKIVNQLDAVKKHQLQIATDVNSNLKKISEDLQYRPSLINLETKVIEAINRKLTGLSSSDKRVIDDQKQTIYELKQKIESLVNLNPNLNLNNTKSQNLTLSYSAENSDIVYYKHQQILKRLKLKNKTKEDAFISLFDMSKISNQEKLTDLKEKLDLEYYSKKRELRGIREKFRKQKFLNIVANK